MSEINAHSYYLMYQEAILSILWLKTGIRDLPLYLLAERRTAAQQQMATAFVRPQPTTSMQLQINIPQQKPGPYSQQAQSQPCILSIYLSIYLCVDVSFGRQSTSEIVERINAFKLFFTSCNRYSWRLGELLWVFSIFLSILYTISRCQVFK